MPEPDLVVGKAEPLAGGESGGRVLGVMGAAQGGRAGKIE